MLKYILVVAVLAAALFYVVPVEAKTFTAEDKYTAQYPGGCKTERGDNRFSDTLTLECKGDIGIQLENDEIFIDQLSGDTDDGMIDTLLSVLDRMHDGVEEVERGTDKYVINNQTAPYVIANYEQTFTNFLGLPADSEDWVEMAIAIKLGNGDFVVGQYRNTQDDFDEDLPMALKVFKSVEGLGGNKTDADIEPTSGKKVKCFDNEKVEELGRLIGKEIDCV